MRQSLLWRSTDSSVSEADVPGVGVGEDPPEGAKTSALCTLSDTLSSCLIARIKAYFVDGYGQAEKNQREIPRPPSGRPKHAGAGRGNARNCSAQPERYSLATNLKGVESGAEPRFYGAEGSAATAVPA